MRSALPLGASNDMNSLHILVVEDEPILRAISRHIYVIADARFMRLLLRKKPS
jgi:hypothetical protein